MSKPLEIDGKRTTGAIATTGTIGAGRIPLPLHAPLRRGMDGLMGWGMDGMLGLVLG